MLKLIELYMWAMLISAIMLILPLWLMQVLIKWRDRKLAKLWLKVKEQEERIMKHVFNNRS